MKISSAYLFNQAVEKMGTVQAELNQTQTRLSTGKQILRASDEPDQAATIDRYQTLIQRQESFQRNLDAMNTRLQTEETALASVSELLIRIKELAVQAANDTFSSQDRQAVATEMRGLRDQILSLANSQDNSGNHIFAGSRVGQPPFAGPPGASPSYQGDQSRMLVPVGEERSIRLNRPGGEVFSRVVRTNATGEQVGVGFFEVLDQMIAGAAQSAQPALQRGLDEIDTLQTHVELARAQVGTDMNVLTAQQSILDDTTLTLKSVLSQAEDLDYAQAIARLNQQSLALQAAQSSFAKISQLSLFNYIN